MIPDYDYEIPVSRMWESLKDSIDGLKDELKPNQYQTVEYGTLYKNTITKMIVDKFGSGAGRKRKNNGIVPNI